MEMRNAPNRRDRPQGPGSMRGDSACVTVSGRSRIREDYDDHQTGSHRVSVVGSVGGAMVPTVVT